MNGPPVLKLNLLNVECRTGGEFAGAWEKLDRGNNVIVGIEGLPCTPDLPTADPLSNGIASCSIYWGLAGRRRLTKAGGGALGYLVGPPSGFFIYSFILLVSFWPRINKYINIYIYIYVYKSII